jgi:hypothetical protein
MIDYHRISVAGHIGVWNVSWLGWATYHATVPTSESDMTRTSRVNRRIGIASVEVNRPPVATKLRGVLLGLSYHLGKIVR